MRIFNFLAIPVTVALVGGLAYGLLHSGQQRQSGNAQGVILSPWDSLTGDEYSRASAAITAQLDSAPTFIRISLAQPNKAEALAWTQGSVAARSAEVTYLANGRPYTATVNLVDNTASAPIAMRGGQPMLSGIGELTPTAMGVSENEEVLAALSKRGIEAGEALCLPRTIGRFFSDKVDVRKDRIVRLDCFYIKGTGALGILPSHNLFARPVEGLGILFNISTQKVVEIVDTRANGNTPPHDIPAAEFDAGDIAQRAALKPVVTSRPKGHNFSLKGGRVEWQGWQFNLRFDARQGTVLNRVGHSGADGFRSVAYEVAMSEMFVPYYDNDPNWFYRAYFDMGEFGFGNLATALKGADCPSSAVYQDVTLHLPDGTPYVAENRICIFEHDPGHPAWRHHESLYDGIPGLSPHQSRAATELVVRMVATIGNYDYFQDYVFGQDGRLRIRLISTGIDAVKGVVSETMADATAAADTATGTLVTPYRVAVNHDHFFSYRIDMDVDGVDNNFDRMMLRAIKQPDGAERRGIWGIIPQRITTERQAQTKMRADRPALLVFSSTDKKNAVGNASSYQLMMPNVKPLVSQLDETYKRAYFVRNNLWVTRFKPNEIFASGAQVNQSAPYLGLPEYIADNENIEGVDIVAWATIGFHHVPMAEDWPVMPSKVDEIVLKPRNYFDRNPAIDLRP